MGIEPDDILKVFTEDGVELSPEEFLKGNEVSLAAGGYGNNTEIQITNNVNSNGTSESSITINGDTTSFESSGSSNMNINKTVTSAAG